MTASEQTSLAQWGREDCSPAMRLAASGAALFSTKAIFIKLAYMEVTDAPLLLALRMIFSLPVFIAIGHLRVRANEGAGKADTVALARHPRRT